MVVRFTYLTFPIETVNEAKAIYLQEVAPAIRLFKGNKEVMLLEPEDEADEFISFSLWQSAEDLTAFELSPEYKKVMGKIKEVAISAVPKYYHVSGGE